MKKDLQKWSNWFAWYPVICYEAEFEYSPAYMTAYQPDTKFFWCWLCIVKRLPVIKYTDKQPFKVPVFKYIHKLYK